MFGVCCARIEFRLLQSFIAATSCIEVASSTSSGMRSSPIMHSVSFDANFLYQVVVGRILRCKAVQALKKSVRTHSHMSPTVPRPDGLGTKETDVDISACLRSGQENWVLDSVGNFRAPKYSHVQNYWRIADFPKNTLFCLYLHNHEASDIAA